MNELLKLFTGMGRGVTWDFDVFENDFKARKKYYKKSSRVSYCVLPCYIPPMLLQCACLKCL